MKLDFGASVPGVSSIEAWLAIGERPNNSPWLAVTASGEPVLRTAQARLYINATVAGGTGIASVSLPLFVELASAEARLSKISCPAGENGRKVKIEVKTGVGRAAIAGVDRARLDDFKTRLAEAPAAIVALPLVSVTAQAGLDIGGETWQPVTFNAEDIDTHAVRTAETRDALEAVTASLVGGLKLKVTTAGLGIGLSDAAIQKQVAKALAGAAKPVDDVLNTLTGLLGVHLGEVDVRMNGVRCHATALVL